MKVLGMAVAGALALAGTFAPRAEASLYNVQGSPYTLGVIDVMGVYNNSPEIYLGDLSDGVWGYYDWGVYPEYDYYPSAPDICDVLGREGRPKDCTREFVAGVPSSASSVLAGATYPYPSRFVGWSAELYRIQINGHYSYANEMLAGCYSNPSRDPSQCETSYLADIENCSTFPDLNTVKDEFSNPRYVCENGAWMIRQRIESAQIDRYIGSWFGSGIGFGRGPFSVNINLGALDGMWYNMMNVYNRLITYRRKYDICKEWYDQFDRHYCDSYYSGY